MKKPGKGIRNRRDGRHTVVKDQWCAKTEGEHMVARLYVAVGDESESLKPPAWVSAEADGAGQVRGTPGLGSPCPCFLHQISPCCFSASI